MHEADVQDDRRADAQADRGRARARSRQQDTNTATTCCASPRAATVIRWPKRGRGRRPIRWRSRAATCRSRTRRSARSTRATSAAMPRPGSAATTPTAIKQALRNGTRLDGKKMAPPMSMLIPHLSGMSEEDLDALVAYIKTLPAAKRSCRSASSSSRCARSWAADRRSDEDSCIRHMSEDVVRPATDRPLRRGLARAHRAAAGRGRGGAVRRASASTVLCRVAEIYERRLNDPNGALVTLQAALEQDPTSGRVVQEMERVARSSRLLERADRDHRRGGVGPGRAQAVGRPVGADRVLGRERPGPARGGGERRARGAEPAPDPRRRAGAARGSVPAAAQLGSLRRDPGAQAPARRTTIRTSCIEAYREVLRYEPQHVGALDGLARVYEETADWEQAADDAAQADRARCRREPGGGAAAGAPSAGRDPEGSPGRRARRRGAAGRGAGRAGRRWARPHAC